jgi:hypothetical protein
MRRLILLWCLLWIGAPLIAQDETAEADVAPGMLIEGTLNTTTPRQVFFFEGSRGEVIRFHLTTTRGNLDPVLSVFDDTGTVIFSRDDTRGSTDIDTTVTIQHTARHFVVVARFGFALGSTEGDFELALERVGVVSEQGTNLLYGIPVINTISNTQPQVYYTFQGRQGDIVNIDMIRSSGTLDPYLQVVDSNRFVVTENDDATGGSARNARIENLVIDETGTYIVVATRYGQAAGESVGSFVLTLSAAENSGLGNSSLAPVALLFDQPVEDDLDDETYEHYYTFTAERDDIVSISMEQISGRVDTYLTLTNAGSQPLIEDDDGGVGSNARINQYRIPAAGIYYIIAGRVDGAEGTSRGSYRLTLQQDGIAFDGVDPGIPRLEYGSTVQDTITNEDPDSLFAFWGNGGDLITISMLRATGDLDTTLELLDGSQRRIASDDDSGGGQNARIERFRLTESNVYYIRATRYSGNSGSNTTQGGYNLILGLVFDDD